jgi:hypothetical protein
MISFLESLAKVERIHTPPTLRHWELLFDKKETSPRVADRRVICGANPFNRNLLLT